MTTTLQETIDNYFACWNLADPTEKAAAVARTWAEEATSSDPLNEVAGHEQLTSMFTSIGADYPGHSFRQVGGIDTHHNLVRWGWEMVDPDGAMTLDGIDVALIGEDGRISYLAGFFGAEVPTEAT